MLAVRLCCARHCELPLSKMGNKGLFPGRVSEANRGRGQPRRDYRRPKPATRSGAGRKSCRAADFLLHTFLSPPKEKCERPLGRPVPIRAGVGASDPIKGEFPAAELSLFMQAGWLSSRPPAPPSGSRRILGAGDCACEHTGGFLRGKHGGNNFWNARMESLIAIPSGAYGTTESCWACLNPAAFLRILLQSFLSAVALPRRVNACFRHEVVLY